METKELIKKIPLLPETAIRRGGYYDYSVDMRSGALDIVFNFDLEGVNVEKYFINEPAIEVWKKPLIGEEMTIEKYNLDEFIGILTEREGEKMKKEMKLFRKKFDESISKRSKKIFSGE